MNKLHEELEKLPSNFIVGIVMPNDAYEDVNLSIMDYLINKKKANGSYVSISKPSNHIISQLNMKNISTDNLHFIDCITKSLGGQATKSDRHVFIDSPAHLTELSLALHEYFKANQNKNRFLYIDSVSTLCIHNHQENVLKFIHNTTGKMRIFGFNGLMLSLHQETDQRLISEMGQFCDRIIHL